MANKKISELTTISSISDSDLLPIVDYSILTTRKTTISQLKEHLGVNNAAGYDGYVQFNEDGYLSAAYSLTYDKLNHQLLITDGYSISITDSSQFFSQNPGGWTAGFAAGDAVLLIPNSVDYRSMLTVGSWDGYGSPTTSVTISGYSAVASGSHAGFTTAGMAYITLDGIGTSTNLIESTGAVGLAILHGGIENIRATSTELVINENAADLDFRIESVGDANIFRVDASVDRIGIGMALPTAKLHIRSTYPQAKLDTAAASADVGLLMYNADSAFRGGFAYDPASSVTSFYGPTASAAGSLHITDTGDMVFTIDDGAFGSGPADPDVIFNGTNDATAGTCVFNERGLATADFRVEGDTRPNLLLVDAGLDRVGINRSAGTHGATLDVDNLTVAESIFIARDNGAAVFTVIDGGAVEMAEIAAPATPLSGYGRLYAKTDGRLYWKNDDGYEFNLSHNYDVALLTELTSATAVATRYFGSTGNDSTGDGSQTNPYRDMQRCIDSIPPGCQGSVNFLALDAGPFDGMGVPDLKAGRDSLYVTFVGAGASVLTFATLPAGTHDANAAGGSKVGRFRHAAVGAHGALSAGSHWLKAIYDAGGGNRWYSGLIVDHLNSVSPDLSIVSEFDRSTWGYLGFELVPFTSVLSNISGVLYLRTVPQTNRATITLVGFTTTNYLYVEGSAIYLSAVAQTDATKVINILSDISNDLF